MKDLAPWKIEPVQLPQKWLEHLKASTAHAAAPTAMPGPIRPIALDEIRIDKRVQARAKIVPEVVDEYAEAMRKGDEFPPLVVFQEGDIYILADGFTRYAAAKRAGRTHINCEVLAGGLRDAMLYAVGANATHGRPRSTADKRCAVRKLLNDDEWCTWSDREIARRCHVSHQLVAELRQVTGRATSERKFTSKHGGIGKMKIGKIGQKSRHKSSSAASSRAKETRQSALVQSTADTNETETTPGSAASAPVDPPNATPEPDGDDLDIPEFLDRRDPADRASADLMAEWQNAADFRRAWADAPVTDRDKFYAEGDATLSRIDRNRRRPAETDACVFSPFQIGVFMPLKIECIARMAKLGITDFPTPADIAEQQKRFLRNLERSSIIPPCMKALRIAAWIIAVAVTNVQMPAGLAPIAGN